LVGEHLESGNERRLVATLHAPRLQEDTHTQGNDAMTPVVLLGISTIDQRPVGVGLFESLDAARDHFETARLPENCLWSAFTPEMGTVTLCRKHAHDGDLHMLVFTKENGQ
jgi:hypothetical protein